jgi:hypothetical protein
MPSGLKTQFAKIDGCFAFEDLKKLKQMMKELDLPEWSKRCQLYDLQIELD